MDLYDFQSIANTVVWKLHFESPVEVVYSFLTTDEKRRKYWAESSAEENGIVNLKFLNGIESSCELLEQVTNKRFSLVYFGWTVSFDLESDNAGGTDMRMMCRGIPKSEKSEAIAGWVSWLLTMKAAVDHGVDLRNHDPKRTWYDGYADN